MVGLNLFVPDVPDSQRIPVRQGGTGNVVRAANGGAKCCACIDWRRSARQEAMEGRPSTKNRLHERNGGLWNRNQRGCQHLASNYFGRTTVVPNATTDTSVVC